MASDQSEDTECKDKAKREQDEWKDAARCEQDELAGLFNKMDICDLDVLRTRLALCLFGLPEDLEKKCTDWENLSYKQYKKKKQVVIKKISLCILKYQENINENEICVFFVAVLGRKKKGKHRNFTDWMFKVPGEDGKNKTFIDRNCRVYQDWNDYLNNNTLPKATICYPVDGVYPDEGFVPSLDFADTPACSIAKDVLFGADVATSVTTLVGCGVTTTALFVPIAAPVVLTAFVVTTVAGAYGAGRSIEYLVDRGKHKETLSPLNSCARSAWLGATVPFFGIAAGAATAIAATARVTNLGVQISQAGRVAINVSNGVNCIAHGVCFANDVYNIIESKVNGDDVSTIQIFQCMASLLFFANAVVSTYQARLILQSLSSKETAGGIENIYAKVSQSSKNENGICIRPTNFLSTAHIHGFISIAVPWSGMFLRIPPGICKSIENIFHFLLKNRKAELSIIASGLIPLLKALWKHIMQQSKKYSYEGQWQPEYEDQWQPEYEDQWQPAKTGSLDKSCTSKTKTVKKDESDKITIVGMNWHGEKEKFQKILQDMLAKEEVSELEVLQYSQLIFQRLREDLEEKEKQFQLMCQRDESMNEKKLEDLLGIKGERSQHFANEIMKSYRDIKIIALKQDCRRLIQEGEIQIPLSSCGSPVKILYYHSIQKHGTRAQKYLKILQKAKIQTPFNTYFPSENSFFVDFKDPNSKYSMAGVVNFTEGEDMMGIIILVENA